MMTNAPLHIAIYARYSSDLQNPSSVDDQVSLCRKRVAEHFGAEVSSARVFSDAAISGATMQRPGLSRLIRAVEKGLVTVIVAESLDRISRSLKDIAAIYETVGYHRGIIWTAHEGKITELHVGLKGTMNALYLSEMKARVRRGQKARVEAGFSASSCTYGYRVVRGVVDERGRSINGVREIDEEKAAVVRRIYSEYAEGRKLPDIVADLNRDEIPAPAGGLWKRVTLLGSSKKMEGLLQNEVYTGKLIANRAYVVRDPITNKKRFIYNPQSEWTKVDVPHLRIIEDELWNQVRERDSERRSKKQKSPPRDYLYNQHALTGFITCGWCGGPKSLGKYGRYVCSTNRYAHKCPNGRGAKEVEVYRQVINALQTRITTGPGFRDSIAAAYKHEVEAIKTLRAKEIDLKSRIGRLMVALEEGVHDEHVSPRLRELHAQLDDVRAELQLEPEVAILNESTLRDEAALRSALFKAVGEISASEDVALIRRMLKALVQSIVLTPIEGQRNGETIDITLREEGWPEFWRMISR